MSNVCVFWTHYRDRDHRLWKWSELKQGRLRQGWGGPGTRLVSEGRPVSLDEWIGPFSSWVRTLTPAEQQSFIAKADSRFEIRRRMLDLRPGDVLAMPHMPSYEEFTLAKVAGDYVWDEGHFEERWRDFGHVIPVHPDLVTCRADGGPLPKLVASRFRPYRQAVNFVRNPADASRLWRLWDEMHAR